MSCGELTMGWTVIGAVCTQYVRFSSNDEVMMMEVVWGFGGCVLCILRGLGATLLL
jgi:hypothetical protein